VNELQESVQDGIDSPGIAISVWKSSEERDNKSYEESERLRD